ncbi:MAG TPA: Maf family nucleotide pyrophosphatase [Burkholderiaceae bacterium]|nr:Maf family nucleotide pyrophosphatase [Burkholderiaceae bacterium]
MTPSIPDLVLASGSPYRKALLTRLGLPFSTVAPDIDETPAPGESPLALSRRLAREKALAVSAQHPEAVVIGSDQVATWNGEPIGKPGSFERAHQQLTALSGQTVVFHTAICVSHPGGNEVIDVPTHCEFRALSPEEITRYLEREAPYDTAGSAKAESLGIALMAGMRSNDPTAIIGLPLIELCRMLRAAGLDPVMHGQ